LSEGKIGIDFARGSSLASGTVMDTAKNHPV